MKYYDVGLSEKTEIINKGITFSFIDKYDENIINFNLITGVKINNLNGLEATVSNDELELDFIPYGSVEIVSEKLKNIIESEKIKYADFYPIIITNRSLEKKYYIMKIAKIINCEILKKSKYHLVVCNKETKETIYDNLILEPSVELSNYALESINNNNLITNIVFTHPVIDRNIADNNLVFKSDYSEIGFYCNDIFRRKCLKEGIIGIAFRLLMSEGN